MCRLLNSSFGARAIRGEAARGGAAPASATMNPSPPVIGIYGDKVTVEANDLAARLGLSADRFRAGMPWGIIHSVDERGTMVASAIAMTRGSWRCAGSCSGRLPPTPAIRPLTRACKSLGGQAASDRI
jgi:hypothetical protein